MSNSDSAEGNEPVQDLDDGILQAAGDRPIPPDGQQRIPTEGKGLGIAAQPAGERFWQRRIARFLPSGMAGRLAQGAALVLVLHGLGKGAKYLVSVLLARLLGPQGFGSYAFALAWAELLAPLATVGFATGVLRFIPSYLAHQEWPLLRGILRRSRQIGLGVSILVAALATVILLQSRPASLEWRALIAGFWALPMLALVNLQMQMIRSTQDMLWAYGLPLVIQPLLIGMLAFGLRLVGYLTALTALGSALIAATLVAIAQWAAIRLRMPEQVRLVAPQFVSREWLTVSRDLLIVAAAVALQNRMDTLLVGLFLGERQAGIYSAAFSTAALVGFFLTAMNGIAAPVISDLYARGKREALQKMFVEVTRWLSLLAVLAGGFLLIFGRQVLGLFGDAFMEGYAVMAVLAVGQVVGVASGPVGYLMNLTGHQKMSARVSVISSMANVALTLLFLEWIGPVGAAIGTTIGIIVRNVWLAWLIRNRMGMDTFFFLLRPLRRSSTAT